MKFLYPVPPTSWVTQTFQEHVDRARANGWTNYNGGIDWGITTGTQIKAAQAGKVTMVRNDATGYGTHVRIQHQDGYLTIYGHLLSYSVAPNQEVQPGDIIALSDNTGNSTGPHLHFELRHNNTPIDPAPLLVTRVEDLDGNGTSPGTGAGIEPTFPILPKARITASVLNIRQGASINNVIIGTLVNGNVVEVIDTITSGNDIWLHIGYQQYCAMQYGGSILAEWA
ncbi:MAG: M23 family metallopeptidase [Anaerolineales bacterium]|nr:M23 family metallopeptidase [Anaerolineales bacterium]